MQPPADERDLVALRRDIHAHPELGFEEQRTSDLIATALESWGIPVHRGLGKTGVVGIVRHGSGGRAIGLRADIDALPITERNGFAHASVHSGVMHACGHDGHTTMLLAAAKHLAEHRNFHGTVYLIFQPAEEGGGGARADDRGRVVRAVPDGGDLRRAQLAGHECRAICPQIRTCIRLEQRLQDHHQGSRWARRDAPQWRRSRAGCLPDGAGLSDHRLAQQAADRRRRDLGHHDSRGRGDQRGARPLRSSGHGANLHAGAAGSDRAAHAADCRRDLPGLRRRPANSSSTETTRRRSIMRRKPTSHAACSSDLVGTAQRAGVRAHHGSRGLQLLSAREARLLFSDRQRRRQLSCRPVTAPGLACCTTRATTSTTSSFHSGAPRGSDWRRLGSHAKGSEARCRRVSGLAGRAELFCF